MTENRDDYILFLRAKMCMGWDLPWYGAPETIVWH